MDSNDLNQCLDRFADSKNGQELTRFLQEINRQSQNIEPYVLNKLLNRFTEVTGFKLNLHWRKDA
jgi:hypothetical protein